MQLTWTHLLNDLLAACLPGVLPYLVLERHVPVAWASALMTILLMGQTFQPLTGVWADRTGGRTFAVVGPALTALGVAGLSIGPSYAILALALLLTGLGTTTFHPQALSAVRRVLGQRQGTGMSVFLIGGEIGRALGPLVASIVIARWGLGHLWLLGVPMALSLPWAGRAFPRLPGRRNGKAAIVWPQHRKQMMALVAYAALRSVVIAAISTFLPILWHARGGSLAAGASLVTTLVGIGVVGNFSGGAVADRYGRRPVLLASSVLTALLLAVLLHVQGLWLWPVLGAVGVASYAQVPVTILLGQDIFKENPGVGSGVALGLANGVGALLLLPLGVVSARWGIDTALWITAALALSSVAWVGLLAPRQPATAP